MQIFPYRNSQRLAVFVAATITFSQPLLASAHGGYNFGNSNAIIAGISSPNVQDDVLYRPRWSLPSNGALEKLPLKDEEPDDDLPVEAKEKKAAAPKAESAVSKTTSVKKPAISRSERLNLGQTQVTSDSDDTVSQETPVQVKRNTPAVLPKTAPATQAPVPTISAPIPGAYIINHTSSSVATSMSADTADEQ